MNVKRWPEGSWSWRPTWTALQLVRTQVRAENGNLHVVFYSAYDARDEDSAARLLTKLRQRRDEI